MALYPKGFHLKQVGVKLVLKIKLSVGHQNNDTFTTENLETKINADAQNFARIPNSR